jgi:EAL domain-containing protein (putative c-di-GMP-specific phosphodiesterase class I)
MPFDSLKIDRCFIRGITSSSKNRSIIYAMIAMAKGMELRLIAEGVETEKQADYLCKRGCQGVQGYLFCRPIPARQIEEPWQKQSEPVSLHRE